jgi:type IV pilus assembly protein PilC
MPVYQYEVADRRGSLSRGTAEDSGTLPTMLARAATYYEQQVDQAVATLASLIEPVMIVVMGAIAGAVIFALYLPIFSIGQAMRGGLR